MPRNTARRKAVHAVKKNATQPLLGLRESLALTLQMAPDALGSLLLLTAGSGVLVNV